MTKNRQYLTGALWGLLILQTLRLAFPMTGLPKLALSLIAVVGMTITLAYQVRTSAEHEGN